MKSKLTLIASIVSLCLGLSSCGNTPSMGSTNLVCASIESYLSTKAMALVDAAQGGSATESVDAMIGTLREALKSDPTSIPLYESYLSAMKKWANAVDLYQMNKQASSLTNAAIELEGAIDRLAPKCESNGWRFESGWRG